MRDASLTPRQVADALGVTVRTVQRWIASGRLPATRVGGRARVARESLAAVSGDVSRPAPRAEGAIRTLLIANRGEVVARVARTARTLGMRIIGIVAPDDRAPDEHVDLVLPVPAYLDAAAIVDAARRAGADAIHPGYGFLAESAEFAQRVLDAGLAWVGPPPDAMRAVGDKAAARRTAVARGVAVLPGYDGADQDDARLVAEAERIGYPLLVKPTAGGGGKGMHLVADEAQLSASLAAARREAARAFGDERVLLERALVGARHVEVQVLLDGHGRGVHLGERDCSTQRRSQKVIEEAPGPSVSAELRTRMGAAALDVATAVGYTGAGTVEFLLADDGRFFFLEVNARLQVEHPVTEALTGRDLVADQLRIAAGEPLGITQDAVRFDGHAIEARVYAEDPESGFLPAAGTLRSVQWPAGVRVDSAAREGDPVSDRYDPLLAKLVAHAPTRGAALDQLRAALTQTHLLGVRSNLRFLRWLVEQPSLRDGQMRTDTLAGLELPGPPVPDEAAWQAAGAALLAEGPHGAWWGGWRPNAVAAVRLRHADVERRVALGTPNRPVALAIAGRTAFVEVEGQSLEIELALPPSIEEAERHAAPAGQRAELTSPMPGRVVAVRCSVGDAVAAGAALVVVEAMKMEHAVVTPIRGTVAQVTVRVGQQVARGERLAEVRAAPPVESGP